MTRTELFPVTTTADKTGRAKIHRRVFTGTEDHSISLKDASRLTKRFRDTMPPETVKGGYFGRMIFEEILAQEGCVGIRCYFASFDNGAPTVVLVGVERTGNDLWEGVLGEDTLPCPPYCPEFNLLNSDPSERAAMPKRTVRVLTGKENHRVTLAEASRLTRNFREGLDPAGIKGGYFGRNIIEAILSQPGCAGIRMYFAITDEWTPTLVLVGVLPNGNDMFEGVLGEDTLPCPPYCPEANPLTT